MRLLELSMRNFRPFYGEHVLPLHAEPPHDLVVIFGENMFGKTAILNAIRWALYGVVRNRLGVPVPVFADREGEQLLNVVAMRNGQFEMEVKLAFQHGDKQFLMHRSCRKDSLDSVAEEQKHLFIGDVAVDTTQIENQIGTILHEDIARFSLFDGEMLTEYERLLSQPDKNTEAVKDAIEKILGLPALTRARAQLDDIAIEYERALNTVLRRERRNEKVVARLEELNDQHAAHKKELERLIDMLVIAKEDEARAESTLREHERLAGTISQISELENQISGMDRAIDENRAHVQRLLSEKWWVPLSNRLGLVRRQCEERIDQELNELRVAILLDAAKRSVDSGSCEVCGTDVTLDTFRDRQLKADSLSSSGDEVESFLSISDLRDSLRFIDSLTVDRVAERIVSLDQSMMQLEADREDRLAKSEELRRGTADLARGDQKSKLLAYQQARLNVEDIERTMENIHGDMRTIEETRAAEQRKLSGDKTGDKEARLRALSARLAHDAFAGAVDGFCARARVRVSESAGTIFKQLTTDTRFRGVRINEHYGLATLDSQGEELKGRRGQSGVMSICMSARLHGRVLECIVRHRCGSLVPQAFN